MKNWQAAIRTWEKNNKDKPIIQTDDSKVKSYLDKYGGTNV
jgi:hypothetical protein